MEKTGRTADPLYPAVVAAHEALHTRWVHLHYRSCGAGKPPESAGGPAGGAPMNGATHPPE